MLDDFALLAGYEEEEVILADRTLDLFEATVAVEVEIDEIRECFHTAAREAREARG